MRKEIDWRKVLTVSFLVSVVVALGVPFQKYVDRDFFLQDQSSRPGSFFGNATFMGSYLLFHVFIGLSLLFSEKTKIPKWIFALGVIANLFAVFSARTVGVIIGVLLGTILVLLLGRFLTFKKDKRISRVLTAALVFFGLFLVTATLTHSSPVWQNIPGLDRFFSFETWNLESRFLAWKSDFKGFLERPVFGWGWENLDIPFNLNFDPKLTENTLNNTRWDKPHNVFVEHLVAGGLLGLFAYLALMAAAIYELVFSYKKRKEGEGFTQIIFFSALFGYIAENSVIFDTIGSYLGFFLVVAFVDHKFQEARSAEAVPLKANDANKPSRFKKLAFLPVVLSILPIYFLNIKLVLPIRDYYWGANYFLNGYPELSDASWQKALKDERHPYIDIIRYDFSNLLQQAVDQNVKFSRMNDLDAQAVEGLKIASERHSKDYFYHLALSYHYNNFYYYHLGRDDRPKAEEYLKEAEKEEQKALELSPNRQQIYYAVARTQLLRGLTEEALNNYKRAVDLNPDSGDARFLYGFMAYQLGEVATGAEEIARARELGRVPVNYEDAVQLGTLQGDLGGDYKSAIESFKLAIDYAEREKNGEKLFTAGLKLAIALYLDGQYDQAKKIFEQVKTAADLRTLPIWPQLEPVFTELEIKL